MTTDPSSAQASSLSVDPAVPLLARSPSIPITWHPARGAATLVAIACMSTASCASESPYNPDHLSATEVGRVGEVCQKVMGFRASEVLTDNLWPGDPDPASQTNNYHGCIATLSNSLEAVAAAQEHSHAERDCLAKGLAPDSADLSVCVLSAEETRPGSKGLRVASLSAAPLLEQTPRSTRMKPLDHVPTGLPREQLACAEIGLDPNQAAFESCVQGLRDVMSASFMAEDYWN